MIYRRRTIISHGELGLFIILEMCMCELMWGGGTQDSRGIYLGLRQKAVQKSKLCEGTDPCLVIFVFLILARCLLCDVLGTWSS